MGPDEGLGDVWDIHASGVHERSGNVILTLGFLQGSLQK